MPLTVPWQDLTFYAFPPFSLLPRVLAKIIQDKATKLLIVPKTLHPAVIPLKLLTLKTVTLLTSLSGQRVSTFHQFRLSQLQGNPTLVIFNIQGLLKHSRAAKRDLPITYHTFPHDVALCPVATLDAYLDARAQLGNTALRDEFFLCYRKPHGPTTNDTLARWVEMVLHSSGVNLDTFTAHSCRSAFAYIAAAIGVPLEKILMAGQWSTSSTFYRKDIVVTGRLPGPHLASFLKMILELNG